MAPEFSVRSESVDVEQIMKQIRQRIREKRGVDYTEEEIRELANVKLEKFLDPSRVRSELLGYYREARAAPGSLLPAAPQNYVFEDETPYASSAGPVGRLIRLIRRALNPVLKLFINPNPFIHVLNMQSRINEENTRRIDHVHARVAAQLNFEIMHNLVVEMTRLAIEVKNLKMRAESLTGRLDFSERRARALETVVQYRPGSGPAAEATRSPAQPRVQQGQPARDGQGARDGQPPRENQPPREGDGQGGGVIKGEAQRNRRRRRRRGRGSSGAPQAGGEPEGTDPQSDLPGEPRSETDGLNFEEPAGGEVERPRDGGGDAPPPAPSPGSGEPTDQ